MPTPTIGFIGQPMTHNLLKAGYPLVVHNCSCAAVDELAATGAVPAGSPREVATRCDVAITLLPESPNAEVVALGAGGLIEARATA